MSSRRRYSARLRAAHLRDPRRYRRRRQPLKKKGKGINFGSIGRAISGAARSASQAVSGAARRAASWTARTLGKVSPKAENSFNKLRGVNKKLGYTLPSKQPVQSVDSFVNPNWQPIPKAAFRPPSTNTMIKPPVARGPIDIADYSMGSKPGPLSTEVERLLMDAMNV